MQRAPRQVRQGDHRLGQAQLTDSSSRKLEPSFPEFKYEYFNRSAKAVNRPKICGFAKYMLDEAIDVLSMAEGTSRVM